jgi:hypothetical protein
MLICYSSVDSIFNTITSDIVSVGTQVTGGAGSVATQITGGAGSVASQITSGAGSVGTQIASGAQGVFETVTCKFAPSLTRYQTHPFCIAAGGHAVTIVTSAGGEAITLATDGVGSVVTFAGSKYTEATGAAGAVISGNSAPHSMSMPSPTLFVGLLTILTSACVGAFITV